MTAHQDSDNPPMTPPSRPRNEAPIRITASDPADQGKADRLSRLVSAHIESRGGMLCFPGTKEAIVSDLAFPGGPVDTSAFPASHLNGTPTTIRNTKLTRPTEAYPGEAERMIDEWTRLAVAAIQRARDATSGPRLVSELEAAESAIREALRWSKP